MLSIQISTVQEFVFEHLQSPKVSKNGFQFDAICPFCGDSKHKAKKRRFGLKYRSETDIRFNCFKCGETGSFLSLYAHVKGITTSQAYKELVRFDPEMMKKRLAGNKIKEDKKTIDYDKEKESFNWIIRDCIGIKSETKSHLQEKLQQKLIEFKKTRKIETPVFVAWRGLFKDRYIIPIIEGRKIIYFQGRAISDTMLPKYLNPTADKEAIIQNKDRFDRTKPIMMTEGILDADAIGSQGTSILGATITDMLIAELSRHTDAGLVFVADNDKRGHAELSKIEEKIENAKKLRYFLMPPSHKAVKDMNELKAKHGVDDVYEFVLANSYSYFAMKSKIKMESWRKHPES